MQKVVITEMLSHDGGCCPFSAGLDKRMRLWHTSTGENTLCNYVDTRNDKTFGWSLTVG